MNKIDWIQKSLDIVSHEGYLKKINGNISNKYE